MEPNPDQPKAPESKPDTKPESKSESKPVAKDDRFIVQPFLWCD